MQNIFNQYNSKNQAIKRIEKTKVNRNKAFFRKEGMLQIQKQRNITFLLLLFLFQKWINDKRITSFIVNAKTFNRLYMFLNQYIYLC